MLFGGRKGGMEGEEVEEEGGVVALTLLTPASEH